MSYAMHNVVKSFNLYWLLKNSYNNTNIFLFFFISRKIHFKMNVQLWMGPWVAVISTGKLMRESVLATLPDSLVFVVMR